MGFFAEVFSVAGLDEARLLSGYQFINYGGEAVYAEGFKKVVSIDKEEICLSLKEGYLKILGEELFVFLLEGNSLIVKGKIKTIEETR